MKPTPRYETNTWHRERWVRGTRFYDIVVHQDLWGGWVATRVNGQVTSPLGRVVHAPADNRVDALNVLDRWRQRRKQRGYRSVHHDR